MEYTKEQISELKHWMLKNVACLPGQDLSSIYSIMGPLHEQIKPIPENIDLCVNLQMIFLCNSHLTSIPESICQLTKLNHLDLSQNDLRSLPKDITKLSKLRTCNLIGNPNLVLTQTQFEFIIGLDHPFIDLSVTVVPDSTLAKDLFL